MQAIWSSLKGKKTYLLTALGIIYAGGIQQGYWPHIPWLDILLGGGTVASLRHAIESTKPITTVEIK